mgnify:FL=1
MRFAVALLALSQLYGQDILRVSRRSSAPATFKSIRTNSGAGGGTTIATSATMNVAAGDFIVVMALGLNFAVSGIVCGTDTLTEVKSTTDSGVGLGMKTFIKQNASANASATCTATFGGSATNRFIVAANYSGVATSGGALNTSCNDASCSAIAATSTSRTAQNVTTTTARTLMIGVGLNVAINQTVTGANSFTPRLTADYLFLNDKSVSVTGSYPAGNFGTVATTDQYVSHFIVVALL